MTAHNGIWKLLDQWSGTAFVVGGLLMVVDAVFVAANILTGSESFLLLGQSFVGGAWTIALIGLLGLYPGLADRSRWLSRAGALFTVIGVVVFATMAAASLAYYAGLPPGEYSNIGMYFIPGVLIGSVLGFVTFSIASLRTDTHSWTVGILLLIPPILVLTNILRFIAGNESVLLTFAIVVADALTMLSIGYVLQSRSPATEPPKPTADSAAR